MDPVGKDNHCDVSKQTIDCEWQTTAQCFNIILVDNRFACRVTANGICHS